MEKPAPYVPTENGEVEGRTRFPKLPAETLRKHLESLGYEPLGATREVSEEVLPSRLVEG